MNDNTPIQKDFQAAIGCRSRKLQLFYNPKGEKKHEKKTHHLRHIDIDKKQTSAKNRSGKIGTNKCIFIPANLTQVKWPAIHYNVS